MNKNLGTVSDAQGNGERQHVGFLDYLAVLMNWRKFIVVNFLVVTALAVIVSFLLPKWYKATASILAPKDQGLLNIFGGAGSVLKGLSALPKIGGFSQSPGVYNYFAILKSRSTMESIVQKYGLIPIYGIDDSSMEKAVKELRENTSFEYQDDDYITIDVYDKDPQRAAQMANSFVEILNQMSIVLATQEARNNREFVGHRVETTKDSLRLAEEALRKSQERSGMMITPEQTSSISAFAELYAMKAKKEIEAAILERTVTGTNEALQQVRLEVREIDKKLATIPQAGLEALRLYRDVAMQQKILEVLLPLYEQAKINEQKDIPVLLVLDKAVPPERKVRPQRLLIVLTVSSLFLFLSIALVFGMHGLISRIDAGTALEKRLRESVTRIASVYRVDARA